MGHVKGTPGYFPLREDWRDGSVRWDVWAMAAIILESNMEKDAYYDTKDERDSVSKARQHLKTPRVCIHLKKLINGTILRNE
jgi:hypothetical protein